MEKKNDDRESTKRKVSIFSLVAFQLNCKRFQPITDKAIYSTNRNRRNNKNNKTKRSLKKTVDMPFIESQPNSICFAWSRKILRLFKENSPCFPTFFAC